MPMPRVKRFLLPLLILLGLTACDQQSDASRPSALLIKGEARYQQQQALPDGSTLTLRLENLNALPGSSAVIAEKITQLKQHHQPFRFQIRVFRDQFKTDTPYALRVLLQSANGQRWTSEALPLINADQSQLDLGKLSLTQVFAQEADNDTLFVCGGKSIKTRQRHQQLQLHINDDIYHLQQVAAASGARYQSSDSQVVFWSQGSEARLNMATVEWPPCTLVSEELLTLFPFRAHGNEPGWTLSANVEEVVLDWNYGQQQLVMPYPQLSLTRSGFVLHSSANERLLRVNVLNSLCRDPMSGKPFPQHVKVEFDDKHLSGCGGNSHALLTGEAWVVEDIDKHGIVDFSRISLHFDDKGRLSGMASCNQYSTTYEFNEQLDIAPPIATRKACAPSLMLQENRFLNLLSEVTRLDFDEQGALLLSTADGSTITARR